MRLDVVQEDIVSLSKSESIFVKEMIVENICKTEKSRNVFVTIVRESIRTGGVGNSVS